MIDTIDFNHSEQYTLSIRLSTEGIALAVFNPLAGEGETATAIEDRAVNEALPWVPNLRSLYDTCDWLHHPFRRVNVVVADRRFTLLPSELFEGDAGAETVFYHNHLWRENERVMHNHLREEQMTLLFGLDDSVRAFMDEQHAGARYYAQATLLIHHFSVLSRLGNARKMYAHMRGGYMDVFCYDHGRLLLANSYLCHATEDRIYYLLYIWQTLTFDQERDELHLCGGVADWDKLWLGLREFIRRVFEMSPARDVDMHALSKYDD